MKPYESAGNSQERREPGLRSRIVTAMPPAPVPEPRAVVDAEPVHDRSRLTNAPVAPPDTAPNGTSNEDIVRSTGSMAIATLISRITGFLRTALIGATLGPAINSTFGTANTLPNLITEIVLGAVLTSLVVPVLVRAEKEDPDRGAAFIRRLFTLSFTVLTIVTILAVLAAPWLTRMMLASDGKVNVTQSTSFAYLLLPQILFYGLFALFMAVLNTKGIFRPGAWAPVANNIIAILVLLSYQFVPGRLSPAAPSGITDPHVLLLGLGTTLGVVVQLLIMIPPLRRAGVDLRPLWGLDDRLRQFGGMGLAIIVYVAISQLGYVITTHIASTADAAAPGLYQYHWLLLQVPYGIIGVTLLTAIMPRLSRNAADGDDHAVVGDLTLATKLTFIALIPVIIFVMVFSQELVTALFQYGQMGPGPTHSLALTVRFSAFSLIPYALVLLHLRVFYAREEVWTPTFIIAGITATKTVLSLLAPTVAASSDNVVVLLGAANGFGFVAGAVIGGFLLHRKLGSLGFTPVMHTTVWATLASLIGAGVAVGINALISMVAGGVLEHFGSLGTLVRVGILGVIFLAVTGIVLSFSRLPEVQNLAAIPQRIPGLRRIIRVDTDRQIHIDAPTRSELSSQYISSESFLASPVPPPMSAGLVRGPRLVPGAPVEDGRYRLLREHGSVTGARFWQAKEQSTGKLVAITFVDSTSTNPATAAGHVAEVSRLTRKIADLEHPAIPANIRINAHRSGAMIVSDWVSGTDLRSIVEADDAVDPRAAVYAFSSLTDAIAAAHAVRTPLGLDNWSRIRITTDGIAMLAFPAVLPDSDSDEDLDAIASALNLLIDEAPEDVLAVKREVEDTASGQPDALPAEELAEHLLAAGTDGAEVDHAEETLRVSKDDTPDVDEKPGFGSRDITRRGTAVLAGLVILAVVGTGAGVAYLAGSLSGDSEDSLINSRSLQGEHDAKTIPVIQSLSAINAWRPDQGNVSGDNPGSVGRAIAGDPNSPWVSGYYPGGFAPDDGIGLLLEMQNETSLHRVIFESTSVGAHYQVLEVPDGVDPSEVTSAQELPVMTEGEIVAGRNSISLADAEGNFTDGKTFILWFTSTGPEDVVDVTELTVVGLHARDQADSGAES